MPAEWDAHRATWLVWPQNAEDWPGKLSTINLVYGEIVRRLAGVERVEILVGGSAVQEAAEALLADVGAAMDQIRFHHVPTNRGWIRDSGPLFVTRAGSALAAVNFRFNAWAKYPDHELDDEVAGHVACIAGARCTTAMAGGQRFVLEGGAVDVDGQGTVLVTEECLLSTVQQRNPQLDRAGTEAALAGTLGTSRVIWLGRGIVGDDTHGHIDDVCRFVGPGRVVLAHEPDPRDENHALLADNRERLEGATDATGARLEVITLPMPEPVVYQGTRLPASYANFYIANGMVLVPTFNDPNDARALGILAECFPSRRVVGIHAVDLVWGLGTLHCLTQQEPAT